MGQYTSRTAKQLLGKGWLEAVHPDDRDRVAGDWYRALREGVPSWLELRFPGTARIAGFLPEVVPQIRTVELLSLAKP